MKILKISIILMTVIFLVCGCGHKSGSRDNKIEIKVFGLTYSPRKPARKGDITSTYLWNIADEYKKIHPEVKIKYVKGSVGSFEAWNTTMQLAHSTPDIMGCQADKIWTDIDKGWWTNLDPYLELPNKYVRGNKHWKDIYFKESTEARRAPDGHIYAVAIDLVETGFFYNKEIFNKVGVKPPKTWAEFIQVQEKLKRAGYIPISFNMGANHDMFTWAFGIIQDQVMDLRIKKIMGGRKESYGFGVSQKELCKAIKTGNYSAKDPDYMEVWRLIKDWSKYFQRGYLGVVDPSAIYRLFVNEKAAMMWSGSWSVKQLDNDPELKFHYGVFSFPGITKESSRFAGTGIVRGVGGASAAGQFAVPTTTSRDPVKMKYTLDYLMFLTAPQNAIPLVKDLGLFIPNIKGSYDDPHMKPFMENFGRHIRIAHELPLTRDYDEKFYKTFQSYMLDEITLNEATDIMQKEMEKAVDEICSQKGWKF